MITLQLIAVVLSLLVLAAHFVRARNVALIAAAVFALALLTIRQPWAARGVQLTLALGVLEWCRTLFRLAGNRMRVGRPFVRLVIILAGVTILTLVSVLVFQTDGLRRVYGLD